MTEHRHDERECNGCELAEAVGRRAFLRDAAVMAIGALAAMGVAPSIAKALPVSFTEPLSRRGNERRYAIPAQDSVSIDKDEEVIIARTQNAIYAFALSCPHQNTALRWEEADHRFQCPKHHSKYRADGTFIEGRATRSMDRFAVRREGTQLIVDLDKLYQEDENLAEWKAAFVSV